MKNIHILPTDKLSRIYLIKSTNKLGITSSHPFYMENFGSGTQNQNIYITSDEEIKKGDWIFDIVTKRIEIAKFNHNDLKRDWKKIILTTDQDLIKDGVQAIDDEFLEWFVNNSSCDSVKIDLVPVNEFDSEITVGGYGFDKFKYKIIIPTEEPNPLTVGKEFYESADKNITVYRQETLEEVAEKWVFETNGHKWSNNDDTAGDNFASFIAGAKWQAERMYSEEDLLSAFEAGMMFIGEDKGSFREWFEQFKKTNNGK
jgi:hypothetical protein